MGLDPSLFVFGKLHQELSLYFNLLQPGGILFGDDYGWPAVKKVTRRDQGVKTKWGLIFEGILDLFYGMSCLVIS